ncbi:TetR/AcrR family transcriptional regulator [Thiohalobacter thiocyanaticus]|uniref:TetR/AcrR family transcriptional regulator n=1 Tax=Thiohalobacter thiocyanaticus TaxID=585455 RepID=A0A426QLQ7_9GAMM|nr:TetR/AcrR family transcriptional regulator [Thiohalobacter thiocyanaticus]RRQ22690.1 TetR/AcrR family transcriptional regulator [Thiohalobacter thiocyanaticus]
MERGRPRNFNIEQALDAALDVFWRNGYQNASLTELTRAMGISKPSLYSAFGNKEQLYLKTLQRYREQRLLRHAEALAAEADLKQALRNFLRSVAEMLTAPGLPGGCMVVNSAVTCDIAALPPAVVAAIHETVDQSSFTLLKDRLEAELRGRSLPGDTDIHRLVDYFTAIMCGMAVMAKVGISQDRLLATIEQALAVLPDPVSDT